MCAKCDETVELLKLTQTQDAWIETTLGSGGKPRLVRRDGSKHEIRDGKLVMIVEPKVSE